MEKHEAKYGGCSAPISGAVPETPRRARPGIPEAALTIARMPARIASGSRSHASMTAARSESSSSRRVAFCVAVGGRAGPRSFASVRDDRTECS